MIRKAIRLLLFCSIAVASLSGCIAKTTINADITGNGKRVDSSVELSSAWSSLEIDSIAGANVYLSNEPSNSVKYSIDENLEKYLDITESNGTLVIKTTSDKTITNKDFNGIDFYIGTNELKSIKSSVLVKLEGEGTFVTDNCAVEISDASKLTLDLDCDNLKIESNGASAINLKGNSKMFNIKMVGAGKLSAKDFKSKDVTLDLQGISETEVYANNSLNVTGEGAFKVTYWGNPQLSKNVNGIGSIKKGIDDVTSEDDTYTGFGGSWEMSNWSDPYTGGLFLNFTDDKLSIDATKNEALYTCYNFENLIVKSELKDGLLVLSWEDPNENDPVTCSLKLSDDGKKMVGTYNRFGASGDVEFVKISDVPTWGEYKNTIYTRAKSMLNEYSAYKDDDIVLDYTYDLGLRDKYLPLIEEYKLDELTAGLSDIELMTVLLNWVCDNVKHNGASALPEMDKRDALSLIDFYKQDNEGLNCRGVSIILSELCNLYGIEARYITCMDEIALEAHVVAEAYSKKYNQWVMLDPTYRVIAKDINGNYINLQSLRKIMAAEEDFVPNSNAGHNEEPFSKERYKEFISKYLMCFSSVAHFTFNSEMSTTYYALIPDKFDTSKLILPPFNITITTSDSEFWKLPTQ